MGGSISSMSYRNSRFGQIQQGRNLPRDPQTEGQLRARTNLDLASAAWTALPSGSKKKWAEYGSKIRRRDLVTQKLYNLTGREAFMGLGSRFAMINLGVALPADPPTSRLVPDSLSVSVTISGLDAIFHATASSRVGCLCELMGFRLASADRAPDMDDLVNLAVVSFDAGDANEAVVELGVGSWSLAYRFVSPVSGEATAIRPLGAFTVGMALVQGGIESEEARAA